MRAGAAKRLADRSGVSSCRLHIRPEVARRAYPWGTRDPKASWQFRFRRLVAGARRCLVPAERVVWGVAELVGNGWE